MLGLVDPYLKLGRAKEHLEAMDVELAAFRDSEPYTFARHDDLKTQRHVLTIRLKDVPDQICLIFGDALYCMRSSLDQLVWSLAKRPGKMVNPEHTQFPIAGLDIPKLRKRFDQQTKGLPVTAIDEIRSFQPYHRGASHKAHPLWRLNALCNLDKHRRIPANGSEILMHFPKELAGLMTMETFDEYGTVSVPIGYRDKLKFHPSITFKVNFGWGDSTSAAHVGISENREGLWEIHDFIRDNVLPRFIRFFS